MTLQCSGPDDRLLRRDMVEQLITKAKSFITPGSECRTVVIQGWWQGEMQWARNQLYLTADRRDLSFRFDVKVGLGAAWALTNQIDDVSLKGVVAQAERNAALKMLRGKETLLILPPIEPVSQPSIWSDATFNSPVEQRARLVTHLTKASHENNLLSAGYIELRAGEFAVWDAESADPSTIEYYTYTQSQCSMTVRHPKGLGAGWSGVSGYDWSRINAEELADRALEKCIASLNPVAIEPGRYTTILEPQAVSGICENLVQALNNRGGPESTGNGPFALEFDRVLGIWRTKIGLKVMDERISIDHDPEDPDLGVIPRPGLLSVKFVEHGILTQLANNARMWGVKVRNIDSSEVSRIAYRMYGGTTSVEEMIATTKRGILVTRFGDTLTLDGNTLLCTGFTRDGLWLIENGKVSKAVKNMRFTESPLFMLNNVEDIGKSVPVFRPIRTATQADLSPAIVPTLKVRDFSFTSLVDAV